MACPFCYPQGVLLTFINMFLFYLCINTTLQNLFCLWVCIFYVLRGFQSTYLPPSATLLGRLESSPNHKSLFYASLSSLSPMISRLNTAGGIHLYLLKLIRPQLEGWPYGILNAVYCDLTVNPLAIFLSPSVFLLSKQGSRISA